MIPKTIHYCWFGGKELSPLMKNCIESWKKHCPDYSIVEWNESNYDVNSHPFTKKMYELKKWAFVADYARIDVLINHGGVYLDTDLYLLKNLSTLLKDYDVIVGKESPEYINTAFLAGKKDSLFLKKLREAYDSADPLKTPKTIPILMTETYNSYERKDTISVLPSITFYPFSIETVSHFDGENAPTESYGVHLYNFSWGSWYQKVVHKTSLYKKMVTLLEFFGIKKSLKALLKLS